MSNAKINYLMQKSVLNSYKNAYINSYDDGYGNYDNRYQEQKLDYYLRNGYLKGEKIC